MIPSYLESKYHLNDSACVSVLDDLPFWSAPFGIKLLDTVQYKKNMRVLDVGCGLGFPLVELAMRLGSSCSVYGLDPWEAGLERAAHKCKIADIGHVKLIHGTAEAMPFENDFFDLIVSNNGLNNVEDLAKTMAECNRVSKLNAQCVFTYNTDQTFLDFYTVFREVVRAHGLPECEEKINAHISLKRKPLSVFQEVLKKSGYRIRTIDSAEFFYRFSDGSSFFNHFMIQCAFLESWKKIIPPHRQESVFQQIEEILNIRAEENIGFAANVPFVTIDCEKADRMKK